MDAGGRLTTDPAAALVGAPLPFDRYKGANIALLIELLSAMTGGSWSVDAPPWDSGSRSPSIGMFVLVVDPCTVDPSALGHRGPRASRSISNAWPTRGCGSPAAAGPGTRSRPAA